MNRSRRSCSGRVDYSEGKDEALDGEGLRVDFRWLYQMVLGYSGYSGEECKEVLPEALTKEWFESTGFREPVVVRQSPDVAERMGMRMPQEQLTVSRIVDGVGQDTEVPTIDVAQQSEGPNYTLAQWEVYWKRRCREDVDLEDSDSEVDHEAPSSPALRRAHCDAKNRLLNVVSLSLAGSELETHIEPPTAVAQCESVYEVWPKHVVDRPEVLKFALMSPAGSYTDFHLDYGGSSVWYHVVSGKKVFAVAPPTDENLQVFTAWAASAKQQAVFLGEYMKGMIRIELGPGDTVLLPGGWPHAVATSRDSLVVGGNFLHRYNLRLQLEVWRVEDYLGVKPKFRFPNFRPLMWYTLNYIRIQLKAVQSWDGTGRRHALELSIENKESSCKEKIDFGCKMSDEQCVENDSLKIKLKPRRASKGGVRVEGGDGTSNGKLRRSFSVLTRWELEGIPLLLFMLSHWLVCISSDSVPADISSPKAMLDEVFKALEKAGHDFKMPPALIDLKGTVPMIMARFKASAMCNHRDEEDAGHDSDWVVGEDSDAGYSTKRVKRKRQLKSKHVPSRTRAKRVEICQ